MQDGGPIQARYTYMIHRKIVGKAKQTTRKINAVEPAEEIWENKKVQKKR